MTYVVSLHFKHARYDQTATSSHAMYHWRMAYTCQYWLATNCRRARCGARAKHSRRGGMTESGPSLHREDFVSCLHAYVPSYQWRPLPWKFCVSLKICTFDEKYGNHIQIQNIELKPVQQLTLSLKYRIKIFCYIMNNIILFSNIY